METETRFHRLPDGRELAYQLSGDPAGTPVLLVHGSPGSRLFWARLPNSPFRPGLRLIAPDRPGFGLSGFGRGRTVLDWPPDVESLLDALGIEQVILFGASGGGPYVLACAGKIPQRIAAVGVFAPLGPYRAETIVGMVPSLAKLYRLASRFPRLIRVQMALMSLVARWFPGVYARLVSQEFSAIDRDVYRRLNLAEWMVPDRQETFRQWGRGLAYDVTIPATWSIPLADITLPVYLWQGEQDTTVPPSSSRYLASQIPDCRAAFVDGAGHFWLFENMGEILDTLLEAARNSESLGSMSL